jgi:predicted histone-like DNA-binding protein
MTIKIIRNTFKSVAQHLISSHHALIHGGNGPYVPNLPGTSCRQEFSNLIFKEMTIKYNVIEKGQPGVAGGGEKKFYASTLTNGEMTLTKLTKNIEKISTVSGADIRAVVYAMVDVMKDALADGQIVRLGDLGSLRISLSSHPEETAEDVNANSIKSAKTIFTPGKELKEMLKILEYEKA